MKKTLTSIVFIIMIIINIKAQVVTLEHEYHPGNIVSNYLYAAQLEVSGTKYVLFNSTNGILMLYNLDHSIFKTISVPTTSIYNQIYYISEHLFDLDNGIEYMLFSGTTPAFIKLYDEDGTLLWSESDCTPPCEVSTGGIDGRVKPIVNTDLGTKLIIHVQDTIAGNGHYSKIKVYNLLGTLTSAMEKVNDPLLQSSEMNLYPNPSNEKVTIQYQLPQGEKTGAIILYDIYGKEIRKYKVDDTFNDILLDNSTLLSGTYFYQLITSKGAMGSKKMVVVK